MDVALAAGETLLVLVGVGRDAKVAVAERRPTLGLAVDGLVVGAGRAHSLERTRLTVNQAEDESVLVADPLPLRTWTTDHGQSAEAVFMYVDMSIKRTR